VAPKEVAVVTTNPNRAVMIFPLCMVQAPQISFDEFQPLGDI